MFLLQHRSGTHGPFGYGDAARMAREVFPSSLLITAFPDIYVMPDPSSTDPEPWARIRQEFDKLPNWETAELPFVAEKHVFIAYPGSEQFVDRAGAPGEPSPREKFAQRVRRLLTPQTLHRSAHVESSRIPRMDGVLAHVPAPTSRYATEDLTVIASTLEVEHVLVFGRDARLEPFFLSKGFYERKVSEALRKLDEAFTAWHTAGEPADLGETLNEASRDLVRAVHQDHGEAWIVNVNDDETPGVRLYAEGSGPLLNFCGTHVLPKDSQEVRNRIAERRSAPYTSMAADGRRVLAIADAIKRAGGHHLFWY